MFEIHNLFKNAIKSKRWHLKIPRETMKICNVEQNICNISSFLRNKFLSPITKYAFFHSQLAFEPCYDRTALKHITWTMDAIKKKMQAMKLEKDNAMDRADACEQQAKDANLRAERVRLENSNW